MKNDVDKDVLTEPTPNDCTEADARNHDNEGIDGMIPKDTLLGYHAVSYHTAAWEDLPSPNVVDYYEPNTAGNEPKSAAKLLLKGTKVSLLEAEMDAANRSGIFGLPIVAELYNGGFDKPSKSIILCRRQLLRW